MAAVQDEIWVVSLIPIFAFYVSLAYISWFPRVFQTAEHRVCTVELSNNAHVGGDEHFVHCSLF